MASCVDSPNVLREVDKNGYKGIQVQAIACASHGHLS